MLPFSAHAFFFRLHNSPCNAQGHERSPLGLRGQLLLFMCKIWLGNCNLNLGHWNWIRVRQQPPLHKFVWHMFSFGFLFFSLGVPETSFYMVRLVSHWPWNWGWHKPWSSCPHHLPTGLILQASSDGLIPLTFFCCCCSSDELFS